MMKASFKTRYDLDKPTAAATVAVNAGDFKLRASMTDATVASGPSLNGLALGIEKPGFFMVDYNVPKKDFRFQFMNTVKVAEKPLKLTYIHSKGDERTILDGTLVIDSANKVSANHVLGTGNTKLKYSYSHGGLTTFEPSYDLGKNTWDFAVSHKVNMFETNNMLRATYQTSSKNLGLEWFQNLKDNGTFKVTTSVNLADERKIPKLCAESTWEFEMLTLHCARRTHASSQSPVRAQLPQDVPIMPSGTLARHSAHNCARDRPAAVRTASQPERFLTRDNSVYRHARITPVDLDGKYPQFGDPEFRRRADGVEDGRRWQQNGQRDALGHDGLRGGDASTKSSS
ncbi:Outer envelope pore protein 24B- chloroplastic [Striga hermonthica]|uniref:Outer envelope pore protein 24B- chloroplastic n=1 Tax=Striga hermonthica TaxID=68872 RepID=A0A9N7NIX8_STRHE|nr:Outer envelope pore protein 24B- chloroplastic [Striga hermonthica]